MSRPSPPGDREPGRDLLAHARDVLPPEIDVVELVSPAAPAGDDEVTESAPLSCGLCGLTASEQPLSWATSVEGGVTRYYCDTCSRENLRAMEGRLDADWF